MNLADTIKAKVESQLPGTVVTVTDTTGTHDHFELLAVSPVFEGKSLVERHRLIYSVVGRAMGNEIHALSIRALTPAENLGGNHG